MQNTEKVIDLPHIKGKVKVNDRFLHSEALKGFFSRPDIKHALEDNNFEHMYKEWANTRYIKAALTEILLAAGIDVLEYLTEIPSHTFFGCGFLTSITIPDSITKIGRYAFICCDSLTSITIPGSVMKIEGNIFGNCPNLKTIYCEAKEKPVGWDKDWNQNCEAKVIWGA